ncbi:MAG: NmrA family transcriptional regulator [Woeseiaceae bacterium]|nr:NmrA family transcriptional regulator [Woeseiaceae bacterium]
MKTNPILVTGATGKTGSRIAARLADRGHEVRSGSRQSTPVFDWNDESSWAGCLNGIASVYVNYSPDTRVATATDTISSFVATADRMGVRRLVFLTGRGETEAQDCERIVLDSGIDSTIVRSAWFNQNFSEGAFLDMVLKGALALPAGGIGEPFVDLDDLADVAVAALTEDGHSGEVYEVSGPRLLTFGDVANELAKAVGRDIAYHEVTREVFVSGVADSGAPEEFVHAMDYLFSVVMDGRNSYLSDGVTRALGRPPKDFSDFAREVASTGLWRNAA